VKPFRLKHPEPREADVLSAVLTCLRYHPRVVFAYRANSGAGKIVRRGKVSQFMRWGFPGCPDVIGMVRGGAYLAIECKRPSGEVSPLQAAFLECVRANGGVAVVARSVDDVLEALK
jgi:hypothetical protein